MRIHKNDNNNDWQFGHSQADFLVDCNAAVAQNIKTKLQEWKYNFFGNRSAGIDYKRFLGQRGQRRLLDDAIKDVILSIDEVLALTKYESLLNDRELALNFAIFSIFSQREQQVQFKVEL